MFGNFDALGLEENFGGDVRVRKQSVLGDAGRVPAPEADKRLLLRLPDVNRRAVLHASRERRILGGEQHKFLAAHENIVQRIGLCAGRETGDVQLMV